MCVSTFSQGCSRDAGGWGLGFSTQHLARYTFLYTYIVFMRIYMYVRICTYSSCTHACMYDQGQIHRSNLLQRSSGLTGPLFTLSPCQFLIMRFRQKQSLATTGGPSRWVSAGSVTIGDKDGSRPAASTEFGPVPFPALFSPCCWELPAYAGQPAPNVMAAFRRSGEGSGC